MSTNDLGGLDGPSDEDAMKQKMLALKKEKKIKIIRMLTVIAYLISVSTVASMLSAYYIFVWDPHATNDTKTPNAERRTMALQRTSSEYLIANPEHHHYSVNSHFVPEVLNSPETNEHAANSEKSITFQSTTVKSSTSYTKMTIGNVSESFTLSNNNS